jgi:hypothetical protein
VVWVALAMSLLGAMACVVLVIADFGRARRIESRDAAPPTPRAPWALEPDPIPWTAVVSATGAVGLIGVVFGGPAVGVGLAAVTVIGLVVPRGRVASAVPPWAFFGPVGLATAVAQWHFRPKPGVEWPTAYNPAHQIMLFAALCLGAELVVTQVRRRSTSVDVEPNSQGYPSSNPQADERIIEP